MDHTIKRALLLVLALGLGLLVADKLVAWGIHHWIVSKVHSACDNCDLVVRKLHWSLLPPSVRLEDIEFSAGTPHATFVKTSAKAITVPLSLPGWWGITRYRLGKVEVERPSVKVTEGDLHLPDIPTAGESKPLDLEIEGIEVRDGTFSYERERFGRLGIVKVSAIHAVIGPIGTSPRLHDEKSLGDATGILETTGKFHLQVGAFAFKPIAIVNVKLAIDGLQLGELNRVFAPSEGVRIQGTLVEGTSEVTVNDQHLFSHVFVKFEGLDVLVKKTPKRSALSAFFENLLMSLKLKKQNTDGKRYDSTGTAKLVREPKQSLVSFILSGMKDAAIQVSTQGGR